MNSGRARARLDPNNSFSAACQHFFRYLNDPQELERNPLTRQQLLANADSADPVTCDILTLANLHTAVLAAAQVVRDSEAVAGRHEIGERHYRIIVEHALRGKPPRSVAKQLGLSLRQFYRDRNRAYAAVGQEFLRPRQPIAQRIAVSLDAGMLALAQARFLSENAQYDAALSLARSVADYAPETHRRVESLCVAAEILCLQKKVSEAKGVIEAARHALIIESGSDSASNRTCLAQLDATEALCHDAAYRPKLAEAMRAKALDALRIGSVGGEDREKELFVRTLLVKANQSFNLGNCTAGLAHMQTAKSVFETLSAPAPDLQIDLWTALADAQACVPNGAPDAIATMYAHALTRAQQLGHTKRALKALTGTACFEAYFRGNRDAACALIQSGLQTALQLGDATTTATAYLDAGTLEMSCGNFAVAEALLDKAEALGGYDRFEGTGLQIVRAQARRGRRRYAGALQAARAAWALAERSENPRLKSAAARELAEANAAMGLTALAIEHASEAVMLAERYASANSLAATYHLAARITGNKSHVRQADLIGRTVT